MLLAGLYPGVVIVRFKKSVFCLRWPFFNHGLWSFQQTTQGHRRPKSGDCGDPQSNGDGAQKKKGNTPSDGSIARHSSSVMDPLRHRQDLQMIETANGGPNGKAVLCQPVFCRSGCGNHQIVVIIPLSDDMSEGKLAAVATDGALRASAIPTSTGVSRESFRFFPPV